MSVEANTYVLSMHDYDVLATPGTARDGTVTIRRRRPWPNLSVGNLIYVSSQGIQRPTLCVRVKATSHEAIPGHPQYWIYKLELMPFAS